MAVHEGRSGQDEREGFLDIFRVAPTIGIRNPGAHELFTPGDPQQALDTWASPVCSIGRSTSRKQNSPNSALWSGARSPLSNCLSGGDQQALSVEVPVTRP